MKELLIESMKFNALMLSSLRKKSKNLPNSTNKPKVMSIWIAVQKKNQRSNVPPRNSRMASNRMVRKENPLRHLKRSQKTS